MTGTATLSSATAANAANPPAAGVRSGLVICPVLQDLDAAALRELEAACLWLDLAPGEIIFHHDDPADAVYFVVSGTVRVFFKIHPHQEVNYAQFGPGEMFGELAAIDGRERSADVITVTDSVLAACPRLVFLETLERQPKLAMRLLVRLAGIVRQSSQRITSITTTTGVQRVYLELLRVANPDASGNGQWVIQPPPLHKDIAGWAGTTPDVVGRAFGHLMRSNLMQRRPGALVILDRRRLEALSRNPDPEENEA